MTPTNHRIVSQLPRAALCSRVAVLFAIAVAGCSSSDQTPAPSSTTQLDSGSNLPEPVLPPAPTDCPALATGMIQVMGKDVQLWVGEKNPNKKAPIVFYWHGTGSNSAEAAALGPALQEIQDDGGLVASFTTSLGTGTNTGNLVWYTDDYQMADYILGCAIQQLNIDTRQIFTAGCSAGGLQAGSMALARSSYIAAAMPNSGGTILVNDFEDPTHIPSVMTAHGSCAADFVFIHFADWSKHEDQLISDKGGFAVDCEHSGGHCGAAAIPELVAAQWQFLKDHPFGITEDPYANGLPASFPSYCVKFPTDIGAPCQ